MAVWKSENVVTRFSQKFSFGKVMLFWGLDMTSSTPCWNLGICSIAHQTSSHLCHLILLGISYKQQWHEILWPIKLMIGTFSSMKNGSYHTNCFHAKIFRKYITVLPLKWPIYDQYILSNANHVFVGFSYSKHVFRFVEEW